jgi:hypothetical protein
VNPLPFGLFVPDLAAMPERDLDLVSQHLSIADCARSSLLVIDVTNGV